MIKQILFTVFFGVAMVSCGPDTNSSLEQETPDDQQQLPKAEVPAENPEVKKKIILFFGNSITAGYGLKDDESFPAKIQHRLDSLNYPYTVIQSGRNGETTAEGLKRIDGVLKKTHIDIFVLELGINDAMQGYQSNEIYNNLSNIIDKVRSAYPHVQIILAGINPESTRGNLYNDDFRRIYPRLAREKEVDLIPQLLKEVYGEDSLTLDDDIHPNEQGAEIITNNVWEVLKGHLEKNI